jgi:hypothetical protein
VPTTQCLVLVNPGLLPYSSITGTWIPCHVPGAELLQRRLLRLVKHKRLKIALSLVKLVNNAVGPKSRGIYTGKKIYLCLRHL